MIRMWLIGLVVGGAAATWIPTPAAAQFLQRMSPNSGALGAVETHIVEQSTQVLDEVMVDPGKAIPASMLSDAQGIAIVPSLIKGGFVIGVKHGRGVVVVRDAQAGWQAPRFVNISGGSLGWQAGIQQSDLILVFKTTRSIDSLLRGKLTIGADAAAAAGPVGRQAAAATDIGLKAEIYSYSRSRGLFAGVALDGSVMAIDQNATAAYYGTAPLPAPGASVAALPPTADKLLRQVNLYTGGKRGAPTVPAPATGAGQPMPAARPTSPESFLVPSSGFAEDVVIARRDLTESYNRLNGLIDASWREYLAIPGSVLDGTSPTAAQDLKTILARYDRVASDRSFEALANRPEFGETYARLRRYTQLSATAPKGVITLPPPPTGR